MHQPVARTMRWRRRRVPKIRVTWIGQVAVLLALIDDYMLQSLHPAMTGKVLLTLAVVVLPVVALALWRAGLLPPERYEVEPPPPS